MHLMLGTISEAPPPTNLSHGPLTAAFIDPSGGIPDQLTAWLGNEGVLTAVWSDADTFLSDLANLAFPVIFVSAADYNATDVVVRLRAALGGAACRIYLVGIVHAVDEQKHKNGLADDYLPVSWPFVEFLHRIERASAELMSMADNRLGAGAVQLNPELRCLIAQGRSVPIKPAEYRLLYYLLRHAGETVTCAALHEAAWPAGAPYSKRNVQKLLQRVRSRVAEVYGFSLVESHGAGIYRVALIGTPN
jgi:DNA-binding response OmpR family regulator